MLRLHYAELCITNLESKEDFGHIQIKKYGCGDIDIGIEICNQYTLMYTCQDYTHKSGIGNITMKEIADLKKKVEEQYGVTQATEKYILNLSLDYETGSLLFNFLIKDSKVILQNEKYVCLPVKNSSVLSVDMKEPESLDDMIMCVEGLLEKRYGIHFLNTKQRMSIRLPAEAI